MAINVLGHVACPFCQHADAHVKNDRGGFAYIVCPDCGGQAFARNDFRSNKLKARMRPCTVQISTEPTEPAVQPVQPKQPAQPASKPAVPKPQPPKKNAPAVDPDQLPPKKKAGWFQPLIGGE